MNDMMVFVWVVKMHEWFSACQSWTSDLLSRKVQRNETFDVEMRQLYCNLHAPFTLPNHQGYHTFPLVHTNDPT